MTEKGCTMAPPLLTMKTIISISCGPASPGYQKYDYKTLMRKYWPRCSNIFILFTWAIRSSRSSLMDVTEAPPNSWFTDRYIATVGTEGMIHYGHCDLSSTDTSPTRHFIDRHFTDNTFHRQGHFIDKYISSTDISPTVCYTYTDISPTRHYTDTDISQTDISSTDISLTIPITDRDISPTSTFHWHGHFTDSTYHWLGHFTDKYISPTQTFHQQGHFR